jgi:hypothetical protein
VSIILCSGLASSVPTFIDIALDLRLELNSVDSIERIGIVMSLIIPSVTYLSLQGNSFLPYIFWEIRIAQMILKMACIASVAVKLYPKNFPLPIVMLAFLAFYLNGLFRSFLLEDSRSVWAADASNICYYFSFFIYSFLMLNWFRLHFLCPSKFSINSDMSQKYMTALYGAMPCAYLSADYLISVVTGQLYKASAGEIDLVLILLLDITFAILVSLRV